MMKIHPFCFIQFHKGKTEKKISFLGICEYDMAILDSSQCRCRIQDLTYPAFCRRFCLYNLFKVCIITKQPSQLTPNNLIVPLPPSGKLRGAVDFAKKKIGNMMPITVRRHSLIFIILAQHTRHD